MSVLYSLAFAPPSALLVTTHLHLTTVNVTRDTLLVRRYSEGKLILIDRLCNGYCNKEFKYNFECFQGACVDKNECISALPICGELELCMNNPGSYVCVPNCYRNGMAVMNGGICQGERANNTVYLLLTSSW